MGALISKVLLTAALDNSDSMPPAKQHAHGEHSGEEGGRNCLRTAADQHPVKL
jgi:hypothetical protein